MSQVKVHGSMINVTSWLICRVLCAKVVGATPTNGFLVLRKSRKVKKVMTMSTDCSTGNLLNIEKFETSASVSWVSYESHMNYSDKSFLNVPLMIYFEIISIDPVSIFAIGESVRICRMVV